MVLEVNQAIVNESLQTEQVMEQLSSTVDVIVDNIEKYTNAARYGKGNNYALNNLRTAVQNQFPLVDWLLSTSLSQMIENAWQNGSLPTVTDEDGNVYLKAPLNVFTTPPKDTKGECCWLPFDIAACGGKAPINILCLKDCVDMLNHLLDRKLKVQSNDLIGFFKQAGQTYEEVRDFMNRESMAFYTANTIVNGQLDLTTPILKKFHGLMEILKRPEVFKMQGTNILAAFDSIGYRMDVLGGSFIFAAHPLTVASIKNAIRPNRYGILPDGWTINGESIFYKGAQVLPDKTVPVDVENGTGVIWQLSGESVGVFLGTTLRPAEDYIIRNQFTTTNDVNKGCATECDIYYNLGSVVTNNVARLAVITDVPLAAGINAYSLANLLDRVYVETLAP